MSAEGLFKLSSKADIMNEELILNYTNSTEKKPFKLTYGVHKELQNYLMKDNNLFNIFTDTVIADEILKIALSDRNSQGQIVKEFVDFDSIEYLDLRALLELIFDYFQNFFLENQLKVEKAIQKLTPQTTA